MFAASEIPVLREKQWARTLPRLLKYLRKSFIHDQQDVVKLVATTDDTAETLRIELPGRQRPLTLRHEQWQRVQDLLEVRGFAVEISARHLTIQPKA